MARIGASQAQASIVLREEMQTVARTGINKAQGATALRGQTLGVGLQGPGHSLTPGLLATAVVDGISLARVWAMTTVTATTMAYQVICQAPGRIMEALNPEITAVPISLLRAGTNMAMATPSLPVITAVRRGMGRLHLKDRIFQARVAARTGEEEVTKVEAHRATGTREAAAKEGDGGTTTHPTMLDRLPTRGKRILLGTPKARQRIGSGSTVVDLGILTVIGMVTGDD